ncbi:MAG: Zn-dependent oligopeptidase [Deltaproteobacteria bacterium]|nr:Zn-dependent oligopeptidase [Deltaproteobacteria bacterium]
MRRLATTTLLGSLAFACATAAPKPNDGAAASGSEAATLSQAAALIAGPAEGFTAACTATIDRAKAGIAAIKAAPAPRDTEKTLELYDSATAGLNDMDSDSEIARNASTDPKLRAAAEGCDQQIQAYVTDYQLDRALYDALAGLDLSAQDEATKFWMQRELREYRRTGIDRDEATRAKVKALNDELVTIQQEFTRNIREGTRRIELDPKDLDGMPDDYKKAHLPGANGKITITTDYPDYYPFMSYAKSAAAREKAWRAFNNRSAPENLPVLSKMLEKRYELATLLGYANWADYITETKMIGSGKAAGDFIDKIAAAAGSRMEADKARLLARKQKDDPKATVLYPWDSGFYSDRVKAEQYSFDTQAARPYFEFSRVQQGVLDVSAKLFDVQWKKVTGVKTWHPEVDVFDAYRGGQMLGRVYLDLHPREGKFKHAAQFTLVTGQEGVRYPEGVLLCNLPNPGATPALMEPSDMETLFHEFGHLVHHILGGHVKRAANSGVRTEQDFVEAPSQMLEEWTRDAAILRTFAKDYRTGEPIPEALVEKMRAAEEFGKGMGVRTQMFYAATSLHLHDRDPRGLDTTKLVAELQSKYSSFPYQEGTAFHAAFGHLEGYSAVYYTYMWSLVIAKDLFTAFEQKGMFDPATAERYRKTILEPGGAKPASALVKDFLGRDSDFKAYAAWLNR